MKRKKHVCPSPIVHTVDRPVEKIVYRDRLIALLVATLFGIVNGYIFGMYVWAFREPTRISYPVYINRIDPSIQAKLDECQSDWRGLQTENKLLKMKVKRLELP